MIRLKRYLIDYEEEALLVPMSGQWYFIQKGEDNQIECFRSWKDLRTALYDLVDLEGWEVLT